MRGLCLKSRELFLQQPILLELEAPLKICGIEDEEICVYGHLFLWIGVFEFENLYLLNVFLYSRFVMRTLITKIHKNPVALNHRWTRRHPWAVHRPVEAVWVRRLSTRSQLPLLRGLCRQVKICPPAVMAVSWLGKHWFVQGEAEPGDYLPPSGLQDQGRVMMVKRNTSAMIMMMTLSSSTPRTSSCCAATTSVPPSTGYMDSTMSVSFQQSSSASKRIL